MGDVALTTPVIRGFRAQYPDVGLTIVTQKAFEQYFYSIDNIDFFFPDYKARHKGFAGILRLYRDLRKESPADMVIDLHDVLRTKILRVLFTLATVPCRVINKGRREKREVIRGRFRKPLKHSVERYADVFAAAGFPVVPAGVPCIIPSAPALEEALHLPFKSEELNIGVAPFTRHVIKSWPEGRIVKLIQLIAERRSTKVWLFGGPDEKEKLSKLASQIPGSFIVTGAMSLSGELALMGKLDFMISMDSSNMHMAALTGTRVISIWGATDPLSGFTAWQQPDECSVRIPVEELTCRPCSVYGKGTCRRGDLACLNWLTSEMVFERLTRLNMI